MCQAVKSPGPCNYRNVKPDAPHRATLISHRAYVEACAAGGSEISTLFRAPGVNLEYAAPDSMHSGDLGCFQDALGSLFWLFISNKRWFRSAAIGLVKLNQMINSYYTANRERGMTRVTPLAKSQIRATVPGYPILKSSAAGCRHLAEFGLALAYQHLQGWESRLPFQFPRNHRLAGQEQQHNDLVVECMEGMVSYHKACAAADFD